MHFGHSPSLVSPSHPAFRLVDEFLSVREFLVANRNRVAGSPVLGRLAQSSISILICMDCGTEAFSRTSGFALLSEIAVLKPVGRDFFHITPATLRPSPGPYWKARD